MEIKRSFQAAAIVAGLALLVIQPRIGMAAARQGLITWMGVLIPSLFPYCFLAIALQRSSTRKLSSRTAARALDIPPDGIGALACGWLGGNPTGAKLTQMLAEGGGVTRGQALHLALVSSACSPAFALGALGGAPGGWMLLISSWLGILLGSIIMRRFGADGREVPLPPAGNETLPPMLEAARSMLMIGCCVVLMSVLSAYAYWLALMLAPDMPPLPMAFLHALLEMAGGCVALSELRGPWIAPLMCFAMTFGGLSIGMQALLFLRPMGISPRRYLAGKALQGVLAAAICRLFMLALGEHAVQTLALSEPAFAPAWPAIASLLLGAAALMLNRRFIDYENAEDAERAARADAANRMA